MGMHCSSLQSTWSTGYKVHKLHFVDFFYFCDKFLVLPMQVNIPKASISWYAPQPVGSELFPVR